MGEFIGVGAGVICMLEDRIPVILDMEEMGRKEWGGETRIYGGKGRDLKQCYTP
jgi:hypothetical protein